MYELNGEDINSKNNIINEISIKEQVKDISSGNKVIIGAFKKYLYFIPEKYMKYFVMILLHTISIIIFMLIYYSMMVIDFNKYYFIPEGFSPGHFTEHKLLIALFMSINFQTTTAYVDLKVKDIMARAFIMTQLCSTFLITFLILFE